ncbi:MAG: hypothetical protein ABL907_24090, partial [Hyphomicrobium sp.]
AENSKPESLPLMAPSTAADLDKRIIPIQLTTEQLVDKLQANGIRLQNDIRSHGVQTSGLVNGVGEGYSIDLKRVPEVEIRNPSKRTPLKVFLRPEYRDASAKLNPGDRISFLCRDLKLVGSGLVWLHDCDLIEQP